MRSVPLRMDFYLLLHDQDNFYSERNLSTPLFLSAAKRTAERIAPPTVEIRNGMI